jgi:hypothetical protein
MNGNEYLALDYAHLVIQIKKVKEELRLLNIDRDRAKDTLKSEVFVVTTEPNRILSELDAEIALKQTIRDDLDAEIVVQKEVLHKTYKSEGTANQAWSDIAKKHQENAKNAIFRTKVAMGELDKVVKEREEHDKATALAAAARDKSMEEAAKEEQRLIRCQYETKSAMVERDAMLLEVEEINAYLKRYRADQLNLEEWDRTLQNKELYLKEIAEQLGVTEFADMLT